MLCLLTSNDKSRYMLDAFRVVALPQGSTFQFRYRTKHVPQSLLDDVKLRNCKRKILRSGFPALVVAVNQAPSETDEPRTIKFFPLRFAELRKADLSGGLLRLDFVADSYCKDMNLTAPGSTDSTNTIKWPHLDGDKPAGNYIFTDQSVVMGDGNRTSEDDSPLLAIQQVMSTWPKFRDYPLFQISAPRKSGKSPASVSSAGTFKLTEHTHYAVDVTHVYSRESQAVLTLAIAPSNDHGLIVEQHTLDTELNVHRFKFATRRVGPVALSLQLAGGDFNQNAPFSVIIEGEVRRSLVRRLGYGAVAGLIAALPALAAAATAHFDPDSVASLAETLLAIACATFLIGPLAGVFARD